MTWPEWFTVIMGAMPTIYAVAWHAFTWTGYAMHQDGRR